MGNLKLVVLGPPSSAEVLRQIGIQFESYGGFSSVKADNDEEIKELLKEIVLKQENDTIALTTSIELYVDNKKVGVPTNVEEARKMLKSLSGKSHCFMTRLCLGGAGQSLEVASVKTTVVMKELDAGEIERYLAVGDFMYPGGYNPVGKGSVFVRSVQGDYNNIKGMPISALTGLLESKYGITFVNGKNIW